MNIFRSIPVRLRIGLIFLILLQEVVHSQDTLDVMYYNVLNYPGSTSERVSYFRVINQYLKPDIIVATEVLSEAGALMLLEDGLNVYGSIDYSAAAFTNGPDTDNMLFYSNEKLALFSQDTIQTALRLINEYTLYYQSEDLATGGDTVFLVFYSAHLKAGTGASDKQKRYLEVQRLKQHLLSLSDPKNVIFGGDLNLYNSNEAAYQSLINDPPVFYDPLPAGNWHDNIDFAPYHTQSTRLLQFGGGASGGLDDRFDFILFSDDLINGTHRASYVPNSCYAAGNDGNHLNVSILDPPLINLVPDSVLTAMYYMSDHLPVMCRIKIELPEVPTEISLELKAFLEGPFNGSDMNVGLTNLIPLEQPYFTAPWNYPGDEYLNSVPENMVDWILVELRDAPSPENAGSNTVIGRKAALFMNDGTIINTDGTSLVNFEAAPQNNIYIVLHHRNHLPVMSVETLVNMDGNYSYDFSSGNEHVYGGSSATKEISPSVWGLISGDTNADGVIDYSDISNNWNGQAGEKGYLVSDCNLDGEVNNQDKNKYIHNNINYQAGLPE